MHLSTIESINRLTENKDFITYVLLTGLLILIIMKALFFDVFEETFKLNPEQKSENKLIVGGAITLVFVLFISLIINSLIKEEIAITIFPSSVSSYLIIVLSLLAFVILKNLFAYLFHIIIDGYESYFNISQIRVTNASWLMMGSLFLVLYYFYSPFDKTYFLYITIGFFVTIKAVEWLYYLLKKFANNNLQWYYKIVYLCTFEILPVVIILKVLL